MSVVIIGGHDRMAGQYEKICADECKSGKADREAGFDGIVYEYGIP